MFGKILALKACAYDFLTLEKIGAFLLRGCGIGTVGAGGTVLGGRVGVDSN